MNGEIKPGRIYVDFLKTDDEGRLLLECFGTVRDLAAQQITLTPGLVLRVWNDDAEDDGTRNDILAEGIVEFDSAKQRFVLTIERGTVRRELDE